MILELDVGNSRLKWRLCNDKPISSGAIVHCGQFDFPLTFESGELGGPVSEVWVSSVLVGKDAQIVSWCQSQYGLSPRFIETAQQLSGVTNSYSDVSHMGVDRWLAIVAAYDMVGESIVVDCGSACTIDIVSIDGLHQGGYILPGFTLMKGYLLTKMKRSDSNVSMPTSMRPGCSTLDALDAGLLMMLVGAVKQVQRLFPGVQWLFTGGDGQWLLGQVIGSLDSPARFESQLVLEGLAIARSVES